MVTSAEELYYRRYLNDVAGVAGSAESSIADSLSVVDPLNSNGLGYKWIQGNKFFTGSVIAPIDWTFASIVTSTKPGDGQLCLAWSIGGPTNPQRNLRGFVLPLNIYVACLGQTQYVQCTNVYTTGVAGQGTILAGLAVQFYGATKKINAYIFYINTDNHNWTLSRYNNDVETILATGGPTVDGDIFRLSSQVSSGQVDITVNKNNSLLASYTDISASRLNYGSPALIMVQATKGSGSPHSEWRTFSAGIGI